MKKEIHLEVSDCQSFSAFLSENMKWPIESVGTSLNSDGQVDKDEELNVSIVHLDGASSRTSNSLKLHYPVELALGHLSNAIAMLCIAGGVKLLVSLIDAWVKEKNGREILVRTGKRELRIRGGVNEKDVAELIKIFGK